MRYVLNKEKLEKYKDAVLLEVSKIVEIDGKKYTLYKESKINQLKRIDGFEGRDK